MIITTRDNKFLQKEVINMKKKGGSALLKWAALFVLAFVLSIPAMPVTSYAANTYTVTVASGYLALRNAKAYDEKNEIGKLYAG